MKKTLLKILTALTAASLPLTLPAVNTIIHTAYYSNNATIGTDTLGGVTYATVHYDGLYNGRTPGAPYLPIDYIRFSVPYNATNFTVTAQPKNTISSHLNYTIYPCQTPRLMNDTTPVVITPPDSAAYYSGSDYPTQRAWVVDEGFLAGENHVVTVAVMPIAYKYSATGLYRHTLKESHSVRLTLGYSLSDSLAMYPIIRNDSTLRAEGYALTQSMVVNPSNVVFNAPVEMAMDSLIFINPNQGDGLNGGNLPPVDPGINLDSLIVNGGELQPADYYPYLIVTTSDLEHSVRRIAALKRQKGYNVKVVTMDEVMNDTLASQGNQIEQFYGITPSSNSYRAGVLRQYLWKQYKYHGTEFVLLVGDGIPYKTVPNKYNDPYITFDLITDLYYSDLSANWDATYNIDYLPELYVGRILSDSSYKIDNYADKLFRYELNPGGGDYSYLANAFFSCGRDFRYDSDFLSVKNSLLSFFPNQININDTIGNNDKYPKGKDIITALNTNHVGFASIYNHGDSARIRVYGYDPDKYIYFIKANSTISSGNGLNCLNNKKYPMVFYAPSCVTIPFDYNNGMSFGESFTTGNDCGGPVYIGYTRSAVNMLIMQIFTKFTIMLNNGFHKLGIADALSKGTARTCYNEILSHAYLGDPELELWTDEPQQYSNIDVTRTNNSITITGIDVDSVPTIVAFYSKLGYYQKQKVSTSSFTSYTASPNRPIMVYKHNHIPYIAPLMLQNITFSHDQYVIANDVIAGASVDSIRTPGDVIVKSGTEYEIEASGTVTLQDGFKVEKGATFAVYPSSY